MGSKYGVIGSGTTAERLVLWGSGFPVIELNIEEQELPRVTVLGNDCEGGQAMELNFHQAEATLETGLPLQAYEEPLREAEGWRVGTAIDGCCGLYIIDPFSRFHFEMIATDDGLLIFLHNAELAGAPRLACFSRALLKEQGAWPVLPVGTFIRSNFACTPRQNDEALRAKRMV